MLEEWLAIPADRAEALVAEVADEVAARKADGGVVTINPFRAESPTSTSPRKARALGAGQPRVPAHRHRGVGRRHRDPLRARRDVRHPVGPLERKGAARRCATSRADG